MWCLAWRLWWALLTRFGLSNTASLWVLQVPQPPCDSSKHTLSRESKPRPLERSLSPSTHSYGRSEATTCPSPCNLSSMQRRRRTALHSSLRPQLWTLKLALVFSLPQCSTGDARRGLLWTICAPSATSHSSVRWSNFKCIAAVACPVTHAVPPPMPARVHDAITLNDLCLPVGLLAVLHDRVDERNKNGLLLLLAVAGTHSYGVSKRLSKPRRINLHSTECSPSRAQWHFTACAHPGSARQRRWQHRPAPPRCGAAG
mmetsp:Transcript_2419/g.5882  ORF Transcript_2419/g.5882 Transcript_2419/m.5882 type:complete len:258 (-) Transcript_2419:1285-2058(-)